jgi:predicted nuclease of predicted toxin-antitoxin system
MKILLDEGLPRRGAALLRDDGIEAVHLTEIAKASTADHLILEEARHAGWIVVTLDSDFHPILAVQGWSSPSVIRIRREGLSAEDVRDLVVRLLNDHEAALLSGVALSVRAHLVGIRKLPLTDKLAKLDDFTPDDED